MCVGSVAEERKSIVKQTRDEAREKEKEGGGGIRPLTEIRQWHNHNIWRGTGQVQANMWETRQSLILIITFLSGGGRNLVLIV